MACRTKIVVTLGPASGDEKTIRSLLKSGMNVARLNLSHGSHEEHARIYDLLRQISQGMEKPLCILLDLQGPKVRIGNLPGNEIKLTQGQKVTLTTEPDATAPGDIPVDFAQ